MPHLLMLVLPPFHPLFCTLLRSQDPGISCCSWPHTLGRACSTGDTHNGALSRSRHCCCMTLGKQVGQRTCC